MPLNCAAEIRQAISALAVTGALVLRSDFARCLTVPVSGTALGAIVTHKSCADVTGHEVSGHVRVGAFAAIQLM